MPGPHFFVTPTVPEDWWKDFFNGLVVEFWRAAMPPEATAAEADFYEKRLSLSPGARVLDVPCGDGRLALELASRGGVVTGVDISEEFLEAARRGAAERGLAIEWRKAEMRDLPWREEFDAAFCGGSSFGFLGDEGDGEFLRAVRRTPGSRVMEVADIRFEAENRYDPATRWMESRYTITRDARRETRMARHRIYSLAEVRGMLEEAGFDEIEALGSLAGEPFQAGSARLIFVAARGSSNTR